MPDEPAIFISYRRLDAGGHGRALHEYLSGRFGDDRVFFDRSMIESGDEFPDKLRRGVEGCAVLLALIGPEWPDVRDDDGGRRLDDADDFVRQEIALALARGKKVIPSLRRCPGSAARRLRKPLTELSSCEALTLRGKTYEYRTQRRELVRLLAKVPGGRSPWRKRLATRRKRLPWWRSTLPRLSEPTYQLRRRWCTSSAMWMVPSWPRRTWFAWFPSKVMTF